MPSTFSMPKTYDLLEALVDLYGIGGMAVRRSNQDDQPRAAQRIHTASRAMRAASAAGRKPDCGAVGDVKRNRDDYAAASMSSIRDAVASARQRRVVKFGLLPGTAGRCRRHNVVMYVDPVRRLPPVTRRGECDGAGMKGRRPRRRVHDRLFCIFPSLSPPTAASWRSGLNALPSPGYGQISAPPGFSFFRHMTTSVSQFLRL